MGRGMWEQANQKRHGRISQFLMATDPAVQRYAVRNYAAEIDDLPNARGGQTASRRPTRAEKQRVKDMDPKPRRDETREDAARRVRKAQGGR